MTMVRLILCALFCLSSAHASWWSDIKGRVDVGPLYLHVDNLLSGRTVTTLEMGGIRGDATILVYQGCALKPSFLWASGTRGDVISGTIAAGYYLPITDKIRLLPNVGGTWSYLHDKMTFREIESILDGQVPSAFIYQAAEGLYGPHPKERFRSASSFIGMDFTYLFTEKFSMMVSYQYAWSYCHWKTTHDEIPSSKSDSCGPNYALTLEYSFTPQWSITLGGGYNITLSKEKHGLRGAGLKLGTAYYF